MKINGVEIENTFAEGFHMVGTRFLITADSLEWARVAGQNATGFATSVIACGCEADIESEFEAGPDGRPGVSVVILTRNIQTLAEQTISRVSQCVLTCPTTACFNGVEGGQVIKVGSSLRYFGDGYQMSKLIFGRRFWRIPVMDGEFLVEEEFGSFEDASDGNLIIIGRTRETVLKATAKAVTAMRSSGGVILPFPGGIVRSGSKVGSKYKKLNASTNHSFCPSLSYLSDSDLSANENCCYEIVVCGELEENIRLAMKVGIEAAAIEGIVRITAGNYGGSLGKVRIPLWDLFS
ncbi:MAG TPA: formylmethanofuran--tetrahydromethanopterin N-formyltransferase [Oscillospiraceae bacterium]|nr:formylmethanofuran--tetrahydromethanopterin N-formyltransferase [Oscillospiraceae bacterium]